MGEEIWVKVNKKEHLILDEGVCRCLNIDRLMENDFINSIIQLREKELPSLRWLFLRRAGEPEGEKQGLGRIKRVLNQFLIKTYSEMKILFLVLSFVWVDSR